MSERFPHAGVEISEHVRVFQRTDGRFIIFDKRLGLGKDHGGADDARDIITIARERFGESLATVKRISDADADAFAGMRRALANGFRTHAPAYDEGARV